VEVTSEDGFWEVDIAVSHGQLATLEDFVASH
jgi:hypothetical protein